MNWRLVRLWVVLLLAGGLVFGAEPPGRTDEPDAERATYGKTPAELVPYARTSAPYRQFYLDPPRFRGPGRDAPEPEAVRAVPVGLFAPLEGPGATAAGVDLQRGVWLALEEANAAGGYEGVPFALVEKNDQALWGSSANTLVELAYDDRVWAVIGSIDSNSTHVALRAALKAELLIVNVGSADPTMTETGIPWIVRLTPDDRQTGYRLAALLFNQRGYSRIAVLRSSNRYGRFGVKEFRDAARRLARPIPIEIQFIPGQQDYEFQLERIAEANVEAVVLWADASDGARLLRQLRARGMRQPVFGTDRLVSEEFLELAGEAAEGVHATCWMNPDRRQPQWIGFRQRFRSRFGQEPGVYGAYGYDAMTLVAQAVRQVGLNRSRIRDALMEQRSYTGVAGTVQLDATSNNVSPLVLARVRGGRFVFE